MHHHKVLRGGVAATDSEDSTSTSHIDLTTPLKPEGLSFRGSEVRARDISSIPSHWVGELSWAELGSLKAQQGKHELRP